MRYVWFELGSAKQALKDAIKAYHTSELSEDERLRLYSKELKALRRRVKVACQEAMRVSVMMFR